MFLFLIRLRFRSVHRRNLKTGNWAESFRPEEPRGLAPPCLLRDLPSNAGGKSAVSGNHDTLIGPLGMFKHRMAAPLSGYPSLGLQLFKHFVSAQFIHQNSCSANGRKYVRLEATCQENAQICAPRGSASGGGEHVEHHAVDGGEHAGREFVGVPRQRPRGRKVERHNADLLRVQFGPQLAPVAIGQAG